MEKLMNILGKVPGIGKLIGMLFYSRKAQVIVIGLVASVLIKQVGMDQAQAAELSKHIVYGTMAWAGYIAIEDHGRGQLKKGDGDDDEEASSGDLD